MLIVLSCSCRLRSASRYLCASDCLDLRSLLTCSCCPGCGKKLLFQPHKHGAKFFELCGKFVWSRARRVRVRAGVVWQAGAALSMARPVWRVSLSARGDFGKVPSPANVLVRPLNARLPSASNRSASSIHLLQPFHRLFESGFSDVRNSHCTPLLSRQVKMRVVSGRSSCVILRSAKIPVVRRCVLAHIVLVFLRVWVKWCGALLRQYGRL